MCACRRALLPSVIAVCLPILQSDAAAAETVTLPDSSGTWEMVISPSGFARRDESPLLLAAAYQDEADESPVPDPAEFETPEPAEPTPAPTDDEEAAEALPTVKAAPAVDPSAYWCVYRTIPFIRTEYLANPSYRHEATMEFLFGQLRPTVIHKHQAAAAGPVMRPAPIPPYVYDIYLGQIPTFVQRYVPPAIPFGSPLSY